MHPLLNALPDPIAILDNTGTITETNRTWKTSYPKAIGINFLQFYENQTNSNDLKPLRQMLQKVLLAELNDITRLVPMGSKHLSIQITSITTDEGQQPMVSLREISSHAAAEEREEMQQRVASLSETNIALNSLLKIREQDRATLEAAIATNVQQLIMPYVKRLQQEGLEPQQQTLLTIIEDYLDNLISPFLHRMATINQQLTPQELKVASLIRQGRSSKEIGKALKLTVNGVGFHRKSIRTKLGLTGSGKNLRSQLMALR